MGQSRTPGNDGETARFPYGAPGETARFPQGYHPGAPYRLTPPRVPVRPSSSDQETETPRGAAHPWELPLLLLCVAVTVAALLLLGQALWVRSGSHRATVVLVAAVAVGYWLLRGVLQARHRADGVKISPTQFPEAHRMLRELSAAMGLGRTPDGYVVPGGASCRGGSRRRLVMCGDLFEVGGRLRDPEALRFLIAHRLGHIAAGHTSYWRRIATCAAELVPGLGASLARATEYTADNHAYAHCPEGAHAIRVLAGGKYLYPYVNLGEMAERARTERGFFLFLRNLLAHRPGNVARMAAIRDRTRPGRLLT